MRKSTRLKKEARESATFRGHQLGRFIHLNRYSQVHSQARPVFQAECSVCGAWVQVLTRPYPNEIEIGGNAVAINCQPESLEE